MKYRLGILGVVAGVCCAAMWLSCGEEAAPAGPGQTNNAPVIAPQADTSFDGGHTMRIVFTATDPDAGDQERLAFSASKKFGTFDNTTHVYTWVAAQTDSGIDTVVVTVSDGDLSATETVIVTCNPVLGKAPRIVKPVDTSFVATQTMTFTVTATDSDGTVPTMTFTKTKPGSSFTISGAIGVYKWETAYTDSGLDTLTIFATDGVLKDSQVVHILCKSMYPGPSGLRVGQPNGGEEYTVGDTMTIMWYCDFTKCTTDVKVGIRHAVQASPAYQIDSSIAKGDTKYYPFASLPNVGVYKWVVTETVTNQYGTNMMMLGTTDGRVRIQAKGTANVNQRDDSDGGFRVLAPVVTP